MFTVICGIKRKEDIEFLNKLKPDYAGFVFAESKRKVTVPFAKQLIGELNCDIKRKGVFVNEPIETLVETVLELKLDVVQLHGAEDSSYIKGLKNRFREKGLKTHIWKAIAVEGEEALKAIEEFQVDRVLLDSGKGGTGKSFSWEILKAKAFDKKIVLAGGLNSENLKEVLNFLIPWAVDVSSSVESEGVKDFKKIEEFLKQCKELNKVIGIREGE